MSQANLGTKVKNILSPIVWSAERILGVALPEVSILCYHTVSRDRTMVDVEPEAFARQVAFLREHFAFGTLDDVAEYIAGKKRFSRPTVVLTFDDGYLDMSDCLVPLLQQEGIPAAVYVLGRPSDANRKEIHNMKPFMAWDGVRRLRDLGWTIGSHTQTHADLRTLHGDALQEEIKGSKEVIEKELGQPVRHFAYPKGLYTDEAVEACREAGYATAVTTDVGYVKPGIDPMRIPRICVDGSHTPEQFPALFTRTATFYLGLK